MSSLAIAEPLIGMGAAARKVGTSRYLVCRAVDEHRIPSWRTPGGHRRVRLSDVRREFALTAAGR